MPSLNRKIAVAAATASNSAGRSTLLGTGMPKSSGNACTGTVSRNSVCSANQIERLRITPTTAAVIAVSAVAGLKIIEFFGISIASFQVGGGTLLLISALQMLNAQPAEAKPGDVDEGTQKVDAGASIAVVPLTVPLLTGPATISTIVIYAEKARHVWELAILVGYGVVIGLVTYITFSASGRIAHALGRTGINVMTRLMGLILAAMAVELLADGLVKLFPVLGSQIVR